MARVIIQVTADEPELGMRHWGEGGGACLPGTHKGWVSAREQQSPEYF